MDKVVLDKIMTVVTEIVTIPMMELIVAVIAITPMMMILILILPSQKILLLSQYGNIFIILIRIRQLS